MGKGIDLARRALLLIGRTLVLVGLPIALVITGGAFEQTGNPLETFLVLVLCLMPVALGIVLAEVGQRGSWRETVPLRGWMQSPVGLGAAVAALSLIAMYKYPPSAGVVAFFALCGFAVLDPVLNVTRRSWWLGAILSIVVWIVLLSVLVGVADSLLNLRESTMVFLLPFMVYPVALGISGVLRLTGAARGWTPSKMFWIAGTIMGIAIGGVVALQLTFTIVPVAIEKLTGNTLGNVVYSGHEGKVVAADGGKVDLQEGSDPSVAYQLASDTQFRFAGPGMGRAGSPAGPSWLKPGQRVSIDYVYRQRQRQARLVNVWVERPCVPAPIAAASGSGEALAQSVSGTVWEGRLVGPQDSAGGGDAARFEFMAGGAFATTRLDERPPTRSLGRWTQDRRSLFMHVNDCYARYDGVIEGDAMHGTFDNEVGLHQTWKARKVSGH